MRDPTIRTGADARFHRTCLHEAAHLAVARQFGATGFVRILRGGDAQEPMWVGRFQLHGELAHDEGRISALAGAIAELVALDGARDAAALRERLERDATLLTGADEALAKGYDLEDIASCLELVTRVWRDIEAEASEHANDALCINP